MALLRVVRMHCRCGPYLSYHAHPTGDEPHFSITGCDRNISVRMGFHYTEGTIGSDVDDVERL